MGAPLYDITIYYEGDTFKDTPDYSDFSWLTNYIADFYHDSLNGYKPPKTGRICITLGATKGRDTPWYFGSICSYSNVIDVHKYRELSIEEKYKYILDLLHLSVSEIAAFYSWEQSIFDKAYQHIIESEFKFEKFYPEKKSKNKKSVGQIILTKTVNTATLSSLVTTGGLKKRVLLLEKANWYWYDKIYRLAKNSKWLDNSSFGVCKGEKNCYYSIESNEVVNDLVFKEFSF